jgi:hypothetical protein
MGLDFPATPTVGQLYPSPPTAGVPVYRWDGEKWIASTISGSVPDPVRYGVVQALTAPQQAQARANINASSPDALINGIQLNGGMEVSQENSGIAVSVSAATKNIVDGWKVGSIGAQVLSAGLSSSSPLGYAGSLQITVPTANAAPTANDYVIFLQRIEGYRVARLLFGAGSASAISIGFWFLASRAGTYSGAILNGTGGRSYVFTFMQNSSAAWEYKTITIPGDTAGTWAKDNTAGMQLVICVMAGSGLVKAPGSWSSGNFYGATGTINGVAATSDYAYLGGVMIVPGGELPLQSRAPYMMRTFDQELLLCKRYYQKSYDYGAVPASLVTAGQSSFYVTGLTAAVQSGGPSVRFGVPMRSGPTVTLYSPVTGVAAKARDILSNADVVPTIDAQGTEGFRWFAAMSASATVVHLTCQWVADARL